MNNNTQYHPETLAIRGAKEESQFREHSQAAFLTSSFTFPTAADGAAFFLGQADGYTYSRTSNPTVTAFQNRVAQLEDAEAAIATSTGMSAVFAAVCGLLRSGDHLVSSKGLFGTTTGLFNGHLTRFGIQVSYVDPADLSAWEAAIQDNTKMLFLETPSNPLMEMGDLAALSSIAKKHKILLAVDNSFCTPALQQPIKLGADISISSATKGLDGQGRVMGGVVCGRTDLIDPITVFARTTGLTLAPFNAWVLMSGLETIFLRTQKQSDNALALALWLEEQPNVDKVYYPGLTSHPQHELAKSQQYGFGSVLSFEVKGGKDAAWQVVDTISLFSKTSNVGDVKSTITHPFTTSHAKVAAADKLQAGIKENLLRLSIGLEHIEDLKMDLARVLK